MKKYIFFIFLLTGNFALAQEIKITGYSKSYNNCDKLIYYAKNNSAKKLKISRSKNNKNAFVLVKNNQIFLKLTGKRVPLVHDPISIFTSPADNDSLLIPIPYLKDGIINGNDIIVEEGNHKYQGYIYINKNVLIVNLQIIDTDDKKIVPTTYNGKYNLKY